MNEKYQHIIDLPHHVSKNHPAMSRLDRAAQFAPYSALSGYEDAVDETARRTDSKIELDDSEKEIINQRLILAADDDERVIKISYFVPDRRKKGGAYVTVLGSIGRTDEIKREITLTNGCVIPIDEIIEVEIVENESEK